MFQAMMKNENALITPRRGTATELDVRLAILDRALKGEW